MATAAGGGAVLTPVVGSPAFAHPFCTPSPGFQHPYPTPSPFRPDSAASPAWSSKPAVHRYTNLSLRFLAFLFAFVSATVIAAAPQKNTTRATVFDLLKLIEFRYCAGAAIVASVYAALQLGKGIWDMAFKSCIVSPKTSDYITFVLDQIITYLLLSSSSVSVLGVQKIPAGVSHSGAVVSVLTSFFAFVAVAASTLCSGFKLCKRLIW